MTNDEYVGRYFLHCTDIPGDHLKNTEEMIIRSLKFRKKQEVLGAYKLKIDILESNTCIKIPFLFRCTVKGFRRKFEDQRFIVLTQQRCRWQETSRIRCQEAHQRCQQHG